MNNRKKNILKIVIAYIDILIIIFSLVVTFKIIDLFLTERGILSRDFFHILWLITPLTYFLYQLYNNPKLNKDKAHNFIFALGVLYLVGNIFFKNNSLAEANYVAITTNKSSETKEITYGDGREQEVYTNPFKIEGLFSLKNNYKEHIDDIKENNEVVMPINFSHYQTGIILGYSPVNFEIDENNDGLINLITKSISYGYYFFIDVILFSVYYVIFILIVLTFYQFFNNKNDNIFIPKYYYNMFYKKTTANNGYK